MGAENLEQLKLFPHENEGFSSPAQQWSEQASKHALDELFDATIKYRSSKAFKDLIDFVGKFRFYSPFNAFLIHIQRPGARFVATPTKWDSKYGRTINVNATPIVILQPMGPVMFVFDVADTEKGPHSVELPRTVTQPFEALKGKIGKELEKTLENAKRDGIRIQSQKVGSQRGGSIQPVQNKDQEPLTFYWGDDKQGKPKYAKVPVRYEMLISQDLSREAKYATLAHELAHLYCGHLGTPNKKWWPDRRGVDRNAEEFEAQSVAHLVCTRQGIKTESESYLHGYLEQYGQVPKISLECVMKAAGLIEAMGKELQKPRKDE